jgi:hypothetical protein
VKIYIIFIGLIVQVNQPWSLDNTAVLPYGHDATAHTPTIEIPYTSIVNPTAEMKNALVNGYYVVNLKGMDVRVEGIRGMFSTMSKELVDALVPLKKVTTGCRLRREVRDRTLTDTKLASFIDYRGGWREPDLYLPKKLTFPNTDIINRCIVCSVKYTGTLRGDTATLAFKRAGDKEPSMRIQVKAGAEVIVRNRPKNPATKHFMHVFDIYEGCKTTQVPQPPADECNLPNCRDTSRGTGPGHATAPGEDCTGGSHGG